MNRKALLLLLCFLPCSLPAVPSENKLKTLYNRLDPTSISKHLAFYELYPATPWGQKALQEAWHLLTGHRSTPYSLLSPLPLSETLIQTLVAAVNKPIDRALAPLDEETLHLFRALSSRLAHDSLKGHHIWSEEELITLKTEEIDLARAVFLTQFGSDKKQIQSYEALIDLMALQILARLPKNASPEQKIAAINRFIFEEMEFRFPPHSLYSKEIDLYTFLPSVLDSHRGVCLGVSILYLCLAQRLQLPLEMITPPGHIYVRYHSGNCLINIETTARGIHLDCEEYLSINTRSLQQRTMREVVGMPHFNQASAYWQKGDYQKVLEAYQKAEPYLGKDPLFKELMGYALLLTDHQEAGERLLREIKTVIPDYAITKNTMCEDYLNGNVDAEGLKVIFMHPEETRASLLAKKEALEKTLERCPQFRAGWLSLAITWLQLHRLGEALHTLNHYQSLDQEDPEAHFYLSMLYTHRQHLPKAWFHLKKAEEIVKTKGYSPKDLKELRKELLNHSPEPLEQ